MKAGLLLAFCIAAAAPPGGAAAERPPAAGKGKAARLERRWFFCFGYRRSPKDVEKIKALIKTGAGHGLNGMVLSSFGLDGITRWGKKDIAVLRELHAFCRKNKMELIPTGFSVGYGGGALGHDRNFAAALPAAITLTAKKGRALPVPGKNLLRNGGLEEHSRGRFKGYAFHDQPGKVTFADAVASAGKTSIRFENFSANKHGHGRIMQRVAVRPGGSYRFACKIKTRELQPASALKLMVLKEKGTVASLSPKLRPTQDWMEVSLDFLNFGEKEVHVYVGVWGGKSGKFWLDELRLQEYATLGDIVRREGTPLALRSRDREKTFAEGKDFKEVRNRRDLGHLTLTPGTAVREGERLALSCYKTPFVGHSWGRQISLCMSNPELYKYWEAQARKLHEVIRYKKVLLAMDEIRNGGGCLSCRKRGLSMAEILGDCITRQRAIFKKIDPEIEVLIWSDMLDPAHNARGDYYGVVGDFTGSWKHVPKDLVIMCWYHKIREESLGFFSRQGFRTFGAAYYDADDLRNPREWLESLKKTRNARGIMYTSWRKKYGLLADFGDLVSEK